MTALTEARETKFKSGIVQTQHYLVAADAVIFAGGMVCLDATGYAIPAADTAGISRVVGIADADVDNTGGNDGDLTITCKKGVAKLVNNDNVQAEVEIPDQALVEDDQTVGTSTVNSIVAGTVVELNSDGIWVRVGLW